MEPFDVIVVGGGPSGGFPAAMYRQEDLGLERWWPDPASVEHACEVGLLPEVRIP